MASNVADLMASADRAGWKWVDTGQLLRNEALDLTVRAAQLDQLDVRTDRELHIALLGFETGALTSQDLLPPRPR